MPAAAAWIGIVPVGAEVDAAVPRDAARAEGGHDRPRHRADEAHGRGRRRPLQHDVGEGRGLLAALLDLGQRDAQPLARAELRLRGEAVRPDQRLDGHAVLPRDAPEGLAGSHDVREGRAGGPAAGASAIPWDFGAAAVGAAGFAVAAIAPRDEDQAERERDGGQHRPPPGRRPSSPLREADAELPVAPGERDRADVDAVHAGQRRPACRDRARTARSLPGPPPLGSSRARPGDSPRIR